MVVVLGDATTGQCYGGNAPSLRDNTTGVSGVK